MAHHSLRLPQGRSAIVVDPVWAGDGRLMTLGRDRRPSTHVPDGLARGVAGVAAASYDLPGHTRQSVEERNGVGQFAGLTGASRKAMARPSPSAITQALVP